jgi:hypothetical protein
MIARIYGASLYGGPDKLDTLWPFLLGGALFAAIDMGLDLAGWIRLVLAVVLIGPGALWALYLVFHEFRSLPERYRRHGTLSDDDDDLS